LRRKAYQEIYAVYFINNFIFHVWLKNNASGGYQVKIIRIMKPLLQDINPLLLNRSLYIKEIRTSVLRDHVHFHNGYEIALILKGNGKRVVGDNIEYFGDNDLVFIGPFLPHVTYNYKDHYITKEGGHISALVVYFYPNWFTKDLLDSADFIKINEFIDKMNRGIEVLGETKKRAIRSLLRLKDCKGLNKAIKLWEILYLISESEEYQCLASEGYSSSLKQGEADRLEKVYKYVKDNYSDPIKLHDVSSLANMTPSAFCKYFKCKTGRTFTSFVNEVRIGQACKLFCNVNMSISEVCYSCGFNNLTNFNRNFKHFTKKTPSEYRRDLKQ
jgi:AraC-like DNA-binding protein